MHNSHSLRESNPLHRNMLIHITVLFPPILILRTTIATLTPILYAIFPPTMPSDRESYFTRDPRTDVPTPKEEWKAQRWSWWNKVYEVLTLVSGAWCVAVVGLIAGWALR